MKKSIVVALVCIATIASFTIFPIKESSAVVPGGEHELEFWGTPRVVVCYAGYPTEVTVGGNGGPGGGGGTVTMTIIYKEGRETKCDGFSGWCNGTACVPLGGAQS